MSSVDVKLRFEAMAIKGYCEVIVQHNNVFKCSRNDAVLNVMLTSVAFGSICAKFDCTPSY